MKKIILFVLISFLSLKADPLNKNQLDSLYSNFIQRFSAEDREVLIEREDLPYEKCGLRLIHEVKNNLESFSNEQQFSIKKILQRPQLDKSFITENGIFRVHYDTSGINKPAYNNYSLEECLNLIEQALDSVYNFEVNILGYLPPPTDGDNLYDIYIKDLDPERNYGYTEPEGSAGNNKRTSYIVIENDYRFFPTKGIDGARVTLAHELHHAIQIGSYIYRYAEDGFFYEITSTAMEEFVYDDINDYYFYLPSYFGSPENTFACFGCNSGQQPYALGIWNIFMKEEFGFDIIKRQWELIPQMRALEAVNNSILERQSTFRTEFGKFGIWLFFTGYRTQAGKYFEEAENYPLINPVITFDFIPSNPVIISDARPASNNFLKFINNTDTLFAVLTNSDYRNGIDSLNKSYSFNFQLANTQIPGGSDLGSSYFSKFSVENLLIWTEAEILNNEIVNQDTSIPVPEISALDYAYPNPFYYTRNIRDGNLRIPAKAKPFENVDVNIYTSAMELVYSDNLTVIIEDSGYPVVRWDVKNSNGEKLPSGVYIFLTKSGDEITSGKFVVFNE